MWKKWAWNRYICHSSIYYSICNNSSLNSKITCYKSSTRNMEVCAWGDSTNTNISSSCYRIIICINTRIHIEPIRMIRGNSECLKPKSGYSFCSIHESPICSTIHTSSHNEWSISTIRNKYLICITISYCSVLCRHHITCIWSLITSCSSLIRTSDLKLWTVIRISSYISNSKWLSRWYSKIPIIICTYGRWINRNIHCCIWSSSECCIYRDHPSLNWDKLTTSIHSNRYSGSRSKKWTWAIYSGKSDSCSIIYSWIKIYRIPWINNTCTYSETRSRLIDNRSIKSITSCSESRKVSLCTSCYTSSSYIRCCYILPSSKPCGIWLKKLPCCWWASSNLDLSIYLKSCSRICCSNSNTSWRIRCYNSHPARPILTAIS